MGRRPPRKFDPELDLSRNFRLAEELPSQFDQLPLFGRLAPLEIEVGSGKGLFLAGASGANPDHNFLGIELAHKFAEHAAARQAKAGRTNSVIVSGDALKIFHEWVPANSLFAAHVYFPDPWWKKRHRKRRVMNNALIADIERTLIPGGKLHFWTDVEEYFLSSLELLKEFGKLEGPLPVEERPPASDLDSHTPSARRMRLKGLPVYRSEFRKPEPSA